MAKTLAAGLRSSSIDFEILHRNYSPMLALVKELIGVVPNCDPILEIWPPAFRTYNLMVPNFLNLPGVLFGKRSFKASMGLAMYAASKAAQCAYCTAHTCSFALRRGASMDAIQGHRSPRERSIAALAEGLAHIPIDLTPDDIRAAKEYFSSLEVERLVFSISMMGFLNKFMNAIYVELEQEAINDVSSILASTGWKPGPHVNGSYHVTRQTIIKQDSLLTYLNVLRQAPGAVSWEKKWTKGVPANFSKASEYLHKTVGYSFPILEPVSDGRVIRSITAILRENLNHETTKLGLEIKMLAGYLFTRIVSNDTLENEVRQATSRIVSGRENETYVRLDQIAEMEIPADRDRCSKLMTLIQHDLKLTETQAAAILLSIAASPSPAQVNETVIDSVFPLLEPASIVELITWLSVLQLLHRLSSYYKLIGAY